MSDKPEDKLELIHFIADWLQTTDLQKRGYLGVRWLCSDEKNQEKYVAQAKELYEKWKQDELKALEERNKHSVTKE